MSDAATSASQLMKAAEDADENMSKSSVGSPSTTCPASQKWTEKEIKEELSKTERGRAILKNLPASTKFKPYKTKPGDKRNAYYSPKEDAIYIPEHYSSKEAAPTAGHEAVHADQVVNGKRPKDDSDKLEMEVQAKNAGLDVYDQMGQPSLPYNYRGESDFRKKDQAAYDNAVRAHYKKAYNVK